MLGVIILIVDWFCKVHILPVDDVEILKLIFPLPDPNLMLLVVIESLIDETSRSLQLQSFINYVVENVNEGVLRQPICHLLELELESCKALRNLTAQRMRLLLVLLERRHEFPEQSKSIHQYGF